MADEELRIAELINKFKVRVNKIFTILVILVLRFELKFYFNFRKALKLIDPLLKHNFINSNFRNKNTFVQNYSYFFVQ